MKNKVNYSMIAEVLLSGEVISWEESGEWGLPDDSTLWGSNEDRLSKIIEHMSNGAMTLSYGIIGWEAVPVS